MKEQEPSKEALEKASKYVFPYDSAGEYGLDTVVFFNRSMFMTDETPEGIEKAAKEIRDDVARAFDAFAADAVATERERIIEAFLDKDPFMSDEAIAIIAGGDA